MLCWQLWNQPCQLHFHRVKADRCEKKRSVESKLISINSVGVEKVSIVCNTFGMAYSALVEQSLSPSARKNNFPLVQNMPNSKLVTEYTISNRRYRKTPPPFLKMGIDCLNFTELKKKYQSVTLWSTYSMLRTANNHSKAKFIWLFAVPIAQKYKEIMFLA